MRRILSMALSVSLMRHVPTAEIFGSINSSTTQDDTIKGAKAGALKDYFGYLA